MASEEKIDLEGIAARLKLIRGKTSRANFSDLIGIHTNTLANYENSKRTIGADVLLGLTDIGINPMWVISAKGDMLLPPSELSYNLDNGNEKRAFYEKLRSYLREVQEIRDMDGNLDVLRDFAKRAKENKVGSDDPTSNNKAGSNTEATSYDLDDMPETFARIPLYDVKASAGNGSEVQTEDVIDSLAFKNEWIHNELHVNPAHLYLIYVEGESMVPSLRPGDVILVDHSDNTAKRDGVYVLRMDGALLVKRLQRLPGGIIKVGSDNPLYDPFEIDLSKIGDTVSVIGRVVWTGRRL